MIPTCEVLELRINPILFEVWFYVVANLGDCTHYVRATKKFEWLSRITRGCAPVHLFCGHTARDCVVRHL